MFATADQAVDDDNNKKVLLPICKVFAIHWEAKNSLKMF